MSTSVQRILSELHFHAYKYTLCKVRIPFLDSHSNGSHDYNLKKLNSLRFYSMRNRIWVNLCARSLLFEMIFKAKNGNLRMKCGNQFWKVPGNSRTRDVYFSWVYMLLQLKLKLKLKQLKHLKTVFWAKCAFCSWALCHPTARCSPLSLSLSLCCCCSVSASVHIWLTFACARREALSRCVCWQFTEYELWFLARNHIRTYI